MDLGMRSTSHYDSMPCMTVASLEMSDEPKNIYAPKRFTRFYTQFFRKKSVHSFTQSAFLSDLQRFRV